MDISVAEMGPAAEQSFLAFFATKNNTVAFVTSFTKIVDNLRYKFHHTIYPTNFYFLHYCTALRKAFEANDDLLFQFCPITSRRCEPEPNSATAFHKSRARADQKSLGSATLVDIIYRMYGIVAKLTVG